MLEGIKLLQWVQSDGYRAVKTDVVPGPGWGFMADFISYNDMDTSSYGCIFGARISSGYRDYQLTTYTEPSADWQSGTFRNGAAGLTADAIEAGLTKGERCMCAYMDGTYYRTDGAEFAQEVRNPACTFPITVFALNNSGNTVQYGKVRLFSLSLFDGTDWHAFAPCEYEGVAGLYDAYNDAFLAPVGGDLTAGPEWPAPAGGGCSDD